MPPELDAQSFAALAAELHEVATVTETAQQVVAFALAELDAPYGGITMIRGNRRLETIAPSSPLVEQLDRLQYELKEGICFDAAWASETLVVQSLVGDQRWPQWSPKAVALGVASALATELATTDGRRIGALNLYWSEPRAFTRDDLAFAQVFGRHASLAMAQSTTEANLRVALDTRKRIGQAQGILMERFDLTEDQSFQVLRRYSQEHNEKLRAIADRIVATRRLPADRPSTDGAPASE